MNERFLDGKGKSEYKYDYDNDVLLFMIQNRKYDFSLELHNFIIDVDKEQFITGIRVLDASKVFNIPKIALRDIPQFEFNARIEQNVITVEFKFVARMRNKLKKVEEHPVQQRITEIVTEPLPEMFVTATA